MISLIAVLRRHAPLPIMALGVLLGVVSGLANTSLIAVINRMVGPGELPRAAWGWSFAGLCLLAGAARVASSSVLAKLGADMANQLQVSLSRRILAVPLRRLEEVGPHRLLATLIDDVGTVSEAIAHVPTSFINFTVVVGCLSYMAWLSPVLLGGVLVFMVIGVLTYQMALRAGFQRQAWARQLGDQLFGNLRGLVQGTKELKTGRRRREEFIQHLETSAQGFRGLRVAAQRIFFVAASWGNLLFFVAIGLILFLLPAFADFPREVRSGFVLILLYMSGPLQVMLNAVPVISQANVALKKIDQLGFSLLGEDELREAGLAEPGPAWDRLELVGVTHSYRRDDGSFILGPLDLVFRPGELVFVVGGNGSGKTTFAKLLLGLYLPETGEVRWNGVPVDAERLDAYRHLFTVVFSDFFLFEKLLGLSSPDLDGLAVEYLHKLRLEHRVRIENGTFSTTELSQGQRKRLALLAALLEDRPLYLFDEWAADQDPEFKEIFYRQILPRLKARGKTVIVISHDDRYYDTASRIIKLENGTIVSDLVTVESAGQPAGGG